MVYTYIYVPKSEVFNSLPIQKVIIHLKKMGFRRLQTADLGK